MAYVPYPSRVWDKVRWISPNTLHLIRLPYRILCVSDTKRTILRLLQVDAEDRMTARQLLNGRWMRAFRTNEPLSIG